jgi:hypothetical protein
MACCLVKHRDSFTFTSTFTPEGKRPRRRSRRRWEDNIRIDLKETGFEGLARSELAQGRVQWVALVNTVMNFGLPKRKIS